MMRSAKQSESRSRALLVAMVLVLGAIFGAGSAEAEPLTPWWSISSGSQPTVLTPGGGGHIVLYAQNRGDGNTSGETVIVDRLPKGLKATGISAFAGGSGTLDRGPVVCVLKTLTCTFSGALHPYQQIEVTIPVVVTEEPEPGERNSATVSGGGAALPASASHGLDIGGEERFGVEELQLIPENVGGSIDTQAGSHPFQLTTLITFNARTPNSSGRPRTVAMAKDVTTELPAGLIGNPSPFVQCTDAQFAQEPPVQNIINGCPAESAIGVATITFQEPVLGLTTSTVPIFNMTPLPGEPARFGFAVEGVIADFLDTSLRSGSDYGVDVTSSNITQIAEVLSVKLTFWGVPGDPRHDGQRGWECLEEFGSCAGPSASAPPFLAMPTSCSQPFTTSLSADSWNSFENPAQSAEPVSYTLPERVDGCNRLPFAPEIKATPDVTSASSPSGLNVDVHVPQEAIVNGESLAESAVKDITVALPAGVAVDPSGGDGLASCGEGLAGFEGFTEPEGEPGNERAEFSPTLPEPLLPGSNFCPDASKIGTAEISTPLLPKGQTLTGAVYLANQNENPFGSLIAMYLVAKDPISGALVKLPGEVRLTGSGQLVASFKNTPQLAFEDADLHFFGGERAPLATPAHCGIYTTTTSFTPWSGNEPITANSNFGIASGPNGKPCPGATLPFGPSLQAGTTNINAGAFSPLTTTIGREDGDQNMQAVTLHMSPGLSGLLSGVKLCDEADANAGTCGPESLIGETIVSAGVGSDPVSVTGGKVYITEKYAGAPFGLSIVNPVKAGPFDLEHDTANPSQDPACDCIVVRAKIEVDPTTAALTITTDPAGAHAIPHLIDGIPVQIKHVNVLINRPGFTFNPTNCSPMDITGSIASDEGASSPVSVPFQATNCATLAFKLGFAVSTSGKTSKADGADLNVKLTYPNAPFGTQANIKQVKVDLPKQLPSRLTTLQKACTAAQFDANPAGCPVASVIGHARAITPLIPVPLEGPAYFVSNGAEAFPNLIVVLQGYGVRIDLVGDTFISKAGITSSTFKTVPDAPVGSFELNLPQGPNSALAANGNLCASKLSMPTEFIAQDGAEISRNTPISVTGCPRTKTLTRAQKLALALRACHKDRKHAKRIACEHAARKRYGPLTKQRKGTKR